MNKATRKALRTLLQVVASGALTALVSALAGGLEPSTAPAPLAAWTVVVTFIQNWLEAGGAIPTLLPSPAGAEISPPLVDTRKAR